MTNVPMVSEAEMVKEVGILVDRVRDKMTSEAGRRILRNGFRAMLREGAIPMMTVIAAARNGHEDADLALRELIIEMGHNREEMPPALVAYNHEALLRAPATYPGGRNLADTWTRDISIAVLVELTAGFWPHLPITRNRAAKHSSACSVVANALLNRIRPTVGERRVEGIYREHSQVAARLSASVQGRC